MSAQAFIDLLGKNGRDRVTGFVGRICSVSFDLFGCVQVAVHPPLDKDGKMPDGRWMDVHRVEIIDENRAMPLPAFEKQPPRYGATPQTHQHGPNEKPAGVVL